MKYILIMILVLSSVVLADFTANSDTVIDNKTQLEWQKTTLDDNKTWGTAITYCEGLTLGGYDDWRLPNFNELYSLADKSTFNPAIDSSFGTIFTISGYWTSTIDASDSTSVWFIDFNTGESASYGKIDPLYVRCVRAGR